MSPRRNFDAIISFIVVMVGRKRCIPLLLPSALISRQNFAHRICQSVRHATALGTFASSKGSGPRAYHGRWITNGWWNGRFGSIRRRNALARIGAGYYRGNLPLHQCRCRQPHPHRHLSSSSITNLSSS